MKKEKKKENLRTEEYKNEKIRKNVNGNILRVK